MISPTEVKSKLMEAITTQGLEFTPSGKRRCNSMESCRILANAVETKLKVLGYTSEDVIPAICMSAETLCRDWVSLDKISDSVVSKYIERTPKPEPEPRPEPRGEGSGEGEGDEEGKGKGDGDPQPSRGGGEGDEGQGEGKEEVAVPVSMPREPEEDGYLKPKEYELVKTLMQDGFHVCLVGPRGTGKTEMLLRLTRELERNLYMLTSPQTRYEVTGYADATGKEVPTQITQAITDENGLLVLEELDRSMPEALIPMNAMLANNIMDVPVRGMVNVSPGLLIAATANTNGHGRTEEYGTAQKLDASTMDRFVVVYMDYDQEIDRACATNAEGKVDGKLVDFITDYRRACMETGLGEYTVSYRGVRNIKKIADRFDIRTALDLALVKAAISKDDLATICHAMKSRNAYANELKNLQAAMKE